MTDPLISISSADIQLVNSRLVPPRNGKFAAVSVTDEKVITLINDMRAVQLKQLSDRLAADQAIASQEGQVLLLFTTSELAAAAARGAQLRADEAAVVTEAFPAPVVEKAPVVETPSQG